MFQYARQLSVDDLYIPKERVGVRGQRCTRGGRLQSLAVLPVNIHNFSVTHHSDKTEIFLTGGTTLYKGYNAKENRYSKKCHAYIIETNKWVWMPQMKYERYAHASCSLGDYLYVFEGLNSRCIEYLDLVSRPSSYWEVLTDAG